MSPIITYNLIHITCTSGHPSTGFVESTSKRKKKIYIEILMLSKDKIK